MQRGRVAEGIVTRLTERRMQMMNPISCPHHRYLALVRRMSLHLGRARGLQWELGSSFAPTEGVDQVRC